MPDESKIQIDRLRYVRLLQAEADLDALYAAGVDNWEGCGEAERQTVSLNDAGEPVYTPYE